MNARPGTAEAVCDLRFGQVGIACVRLRRDDAAALHEELDKRVRSAPQLFQRAAVVLDLSHLPALPDDGAVDALLEAIRAAGMLPVGLAYGTAETEALAKRMGLPLIAKFRAAYERDNGEPAVPAAAAPARARPAAAAEADAVHGAQQHAQPVRSGQQVYARGRDLVVTAPVANGAEVIADGSVHVYGALRGRALAGAQGETRARIYCTEFRAELVSIAGQYRVFEQIPAEFDGQPVQIWLDGDKLRIARLER
ncbi:MAG TPA: septum site-determining protein MinC [Mizugakiibacter sp.]|uniref:Probable septum site-determining protein MinC n=2 Tax=Mizugakiibacter sediminis TaxID=1475481 RepID=A0A0K8QM06_9GAMM|nr:septum site-determining protein MinC [Mizugakiibacter sediminis]GAP65731.1 septum site-determining protein MinC [Mizugakiibacter sediminis]